FGLRRWDDRAVDPENLKRMQSALAPWGPDGSAIWHHNQIGLGHLLLRNTDESIHEFSPLKRDQFVLTASARLDNRDDLIKTLGIQNAAATPDVALILHAYEKWNEDCVDHLFGDFTFAIWDGRKQSLFLARDHHGISGLVFYRNEKFFAFASSLPGLFALPEIPRRPNAMYVACILVAWQRNGSQTAYENIYR